jgi:hypothetical protein
VAMENLYVAIEWLWVLGLPAYGRYLGDCNQTILASDKKRTAIHGFRLRCDFRVNLNDVGDGFVERPAALRFLCASLSSPKFCRESPL